MLTDGLAAVEAACREAFDQDVHCADVIVNILARHRDPVPALTNLTPDALRLRHVAMADWRPELRKLRSFRVSQYQEKVGSRRHSLRQVCLSKRLRALRFEQG